RSWRSATSRAGIRAAPRTPPRSSSSRRAPGLSAPPLDARLEIDASVPHVFTHASPPRRTERSGAASGATIAEEPADETTDRAADDWLLAAGAPAPHGPLRRERMTGTRLDKWLWAARFFKTRGLSSDEIGKGRVTVNGQPAKPSREVRVGDAI